MILNKIEQIVEENSCTTLKTIREKISETEHVELSISSIRNSLSTIEDRKIYALHFSRNAPQLRQKIIFIDESGFNCHLRRTKARSKINTPARVIVPTVRGRNVSLIAAINIQGMNSISSDNCALYC